MAGVFLCAGRNCNRRGKGHTEILHSDAREAKHPAPDGWAISSAGEHFVDIEGVTGSIPVSPTINFKDLAVIHHIYT